MKINKLVLLLLSLTFLVACKQDKWNELARKEVEYLDGNYQVTYANGSVAKTWIVKNGKVTSHEKGYYFFWDEKKHYVQTPMENTFIEEF